MHKLTGGRPDPVLRTPLQITKISTGELWDRVIGVSDSEVDESISRCDKSRKYSISDTRAAVGILEPLC
jgi:hypothetical protein